MTTSKPKRWTLREIAAVNEAGGYYFFSPGAMRFFGDTMASFKVVHKDGRVFVQRVKPAHNAPRGVAMDTRLREFFPDTGRIGSHIDEVM